MGLQIPRGKSQLYASGHKEYCIVFRNGFFRQSRKDIPSQKKIYFDGKVRYLTCPKKISYFAKSVLLLSKAIWQPEDMTTPPPCRGGGPKGRRGFACTRVTSRIPLHTVLLNVSCGCYRGREPPPAPSGLVPLRGGTVLASEWQTRSNSFCHPAGLLENAHKKEGCPQCHGGRATFLF